MMLNQWLMLTPQLLIASGIVLSLLLIAWHRSQWMIFAFTMSVLLVALFANISFIGQTSQQVTQLVYIDDFSRIAYTWCLVTAIASLYMSRLCLRAEIEVHDEYYTLLLLVVLGAGVLVSSDHFASLFLGFELLSLSLVGLIGYFRQQIYSIEASFKYLILSASASSFMLLGIAFIYSQTGSLSFHITFSDGDNVIAQLGLLLFFSGIAFKLSLVPFHFWTPDVYQGASSPVTFLLATLSKTAMFIVLIKCVYSEALSEMISTTNIQLALSVVAILSMILGNCLALKQQILKRLLAFASIAHMGYLLMVVLIHQQEAMLLAKQSVLFYLIAYIIANVATFGVVTLTEREENIRDDLTIMHWQGLFWRAPLRAIVLICAILSFAGIPLTVGFIGKFYLMSVATTNELWWLLAALIIGSGVALAYYLPIVFTLFTKSEQATKHSQSWRVQLWLTAVMLVIIGLGVFPQLVLPNIT